MGVFWCFVVRMEGRTNAQNKGAEHEEERWRRDMEHKAKDARVQEARADARSMAREKDAAARDRAKGGEAKLREIGNR